MSAQAAHGSDERSGARTACVRVLTYITSITFITSITCVSALSAEPFAAPKAAEPVTTTTAGGLAQVTISLLLVLGAVFAAAWAMRRLRGFGRVAPGAIEVVADVALGQKERAVLVQIGKQQLLLGVAAGSVTTLHVLPEPIAVNPQPSLLAKKAADSTLGPSSSSVPPHLQFKEILKRSFGV